MAEIEFARFAPLDYSCSEAFNALCANFSFSGAKKVMLTSCHMSEGKSFVSMNIMRTMARLGRRVALVDADLRRSTINTEFGVKFPEGENRGLAHYLAGMCRMEDIVFSTNIDGAYFVPIGRKVSNSLGLLSKPGLPRLLNYLAEHFDVVLVDAPPVGIIIDAAEISKSCDGTLLVVTYNNIARRELANAKQQIERAGSAVLGAVLNQVTFDSYSSKRYYNKSYYSNYSYGYYKTSSPRRSAREKVPKKR